MEEVTADLLVESFGKDMLPDTDVLVNYWGDNCFDDYDERIIYGVYKDLYAKGVDSKLFDQCFLENRLDELIHTKNKKTPSGHYNKFVERNIVIGPTCYFPNPRKTRIADDGECPTCYNKHERFPFIVDGPPDCANCGKVICENCSQYDEDKCSYICYRCDTSGLKKKLSTYKISDLKAFGREGNLSVDDVIKLIKKQSGNCYVCDEPVILANWKPHCCYQLSIDRINNGLPHDRGNVLISCYYCNCRHHHDFIQLNKVCTAGCHTEPKNIIPRTLVSADKINELLD